MAGIKSGINGQINNNIVTDGLEFYIDPAYKISYPGTGTTITDTIFNKTGTMSGVVFLTNNNGILNFDGSDAITSITVDNSHSTFSVGAWVNPNSFANFIRIIELNNSNRRFLGVHGDGTLISGYGFWNEKFTTSTISTGTWNYIVMVDNGSSTIIYVNNVANAIANSAATNTSYIIGSYLGTQNFLDAQLGPLKVYNRALSSEEVLQNYQAQKERFGL
jgi:hypothetical protein